MPQKALNVYQTLSLLEGGVWEQDYCFPNPVSVMLVTCKIHISRVGHMIAISAVLNVESWLLNIASAVRSHKGQGELLLYNICTISVN